MPKVRLIASTPKLDTALKKLVNGIGTTKLTGAGDAAHKPQELYSSNQPASKSGSAGEYEYNGYFKAVLVTETENGQEAKKVKIINGSDPENEICGRTDLGNVQSATFPFSAGYSVFVKAEYANGRWGQELVMLESAMEGVMLQRIADCVKYTDDTLYQVWTDGQIYFGSRYWI